MYKLALALIVASCAAAPAVAQQCISKDQAQAVIDNLGMSEVNSGVHPDGQIVTYANPNTSQFLITLENETVSCLIANGTNFKVAGYGVQL
jgi:hypothetical protein